MDEKKQKLIEELHSLNVFKSINGINLNELDFDELQFELILAVFRRIDIERDANKWF